MYNMYSSRILCELFAEIFAEIFANTGALRLLLYSPTFLWALLIVLNFLLAGSRIIIGIIRMHEPNILA